MWRHREVDLESAPEPYARTVDPAEHAEHSALQAAVRDGIATALTERQQSVLVSIVIDEVPIDVVAHRLGTTRNAVYKTLHDARKKLRARLVSDGFLTHESTIEVTAS